MPRYDYSGCPRDGPIVAMDTHGCGKLGRKICGGWQGGGKTVRVESELSIQLIKLKEQSFKFLALFLLSKSTITNNQEPISYQEI